MTWWTLQRLNHTAKLHNTGTYSEISDTNRHALVYKCRCDWWVGLLNFVRLVQNFPLG